MVACHWNTNKTFSNSSKKRIDGSIWTQNDLKFSKIYIELLTKNNLPQNPTNITESSEFKNFCKSNNLDVLNLESINVFLYQLEESLKIAHDRIDETQTAQTVLEKLHNSLVDEVYDPKIELIKRIIQLEEENKELREMIMEIAKNIKSPDIQQINENWNLEVTYWWTLFDKWNNKWTSEN